MPGIHNGLFNVVALMKTRIVHHHHAFLRGFRQQILLHPSQKHIGIDRAAEQAGGEQTRAQQGPDDIGSAVCVPVVLAKTPFANRRIAVSARHVVRKTAFVNIDDGPVGCLMVF